MLGSILWSTPLVTGRPPRRASGAWLPLSGAWLPAEVPKGEQQGGSAPGTDDKHVAPVEGRAQEDRLYTVGEVLDREDASNPGDPHWCVVTDRDKDLSLIHISEPTRQAEISYAVF